MKTITLILALVVGVVVGAVFNLVKDKKNSNTKNKDNILN